MPARRCWWAGGALAATLAGCHHTALPPRPDGAAVVIAGDSQTPEADVPTTAEVEPNDTPATAQSLIVTPAAPVAVAGSLRAPGAAGARRDVDVFRVDVAAPDAGAAAGDGGVRARAPIASLRVDVRPGPALAVILDALDAAGQPSISIPAGAPGEAAAIPNLALFPGSAYVRVRAAGPDAAPADGYRLIVHVAPFETGAEVEPNGAAAAATALGPNSEAVGYLGWRHDQDWYRVPTVDLAEGSLLSVDIDPVPGVAASLTVLDAAARKLVDARGRRGERVVLRNVRVPAAEPQLYVVARADSGSNADARYSLRTRSEPAKPGAETEPNDDPAHAQAIGDGAMLGYLGRGDVDVFRYTTGGATTLDITLEPPERLDAKLDVVRDDGTRLAHGVASARRPLRLVGLASPGGALLIRLGVGAGAGNPDEPYRLTIASRPLAAADGGGPGAEAR